MKKLQCELCGSTDIIKTDDNIFECQYCGCKYTFEQAKSLISGTVTALQPDFTIRAGCLEKYNGEATDIVIPDNVIRIGNEVFAKTGITSVVFPAGLKEVGTDAFRQCNKLKSVTMNEGLELIAPLAFGFCRALKVIVFPKSLKEIFMNSFHFCYAINDITIPEELKERKQLYDLLMADYGPLKDTVWFREYKKKLEGERVSRGECRHCGGSFKGRFLPKCSKCGKPKDY